jgi:hypothetical protein
VGTERRAAITAENALLRDARISSNAAKQVVQAVVSKSPANTSIVTRLVGEPDVPSLA